MSYQNNLTQNVAIVSVIALGLLPSNPAKAADLKIGNVKKIFPTDAACVSFNPKTPEKRILVALGNSAWININSKDVELKLVSQKKINQKKSVFKYQTKELIVVINETLIREDNGDGVQPPIIDYKQIISIKRGQSLRTLQLNARC
jgi:hypothetical protein